MGDKTFKEELLGRLGGLWEGRKPGSVSGGAVRAWTEKQAEDWVQRALKKLKLSAATLRDPPKGAVEKQVLAWGLRSHSTLFRAWIAERLWMGHETRSQAVRAVGEARWGSLVRMRRKVESIQVQGNRPAEPSYAEGGGHGRMAW